MSRLDNLRQRWRDSPENSDNWDLARWIIERQNHRYIGLLFATIYSFLVLFESFTIFKIPALFRGLMLLMFCLVLVLDYIEGLKIHRLEQAEEGSA